jgi:hypothetical protein
MGTIYRNREGKPDPLVTVCVVRGNWTAESESLECQKYVNSILPKEPYRGESDAERIIKLMERNGFVRGGVLSDVDRDPARTLTFIFDHVETAETMRVSS